MDTCPDCGSTDVAPRVREGVVVHECGLCGAVGGDPAAVAAVQAAVEARDHGVDAAVWPLVRALRALPGCRVERSHAGAVDLQTLPFVQLQLADARALVQLENLVKSLLLAARSLRLHWVVELELHHHLVFVLKPRPVAISPASVADARVDLEALPRILDRDSRLSWWRRS